jgi:hypothetical protein
MAVRTLWSDPVRDDDVLRFHAIGQEAGTPWRDFEVEYAPVETAIVLAVATDSPAATGTAIVLVALACDLITAAALRSGWGRRATATYLAVGLPLLSFSYFRLDLLVVALLTLGFLLVRRAKDSAGGLVLALAVLTKLWPAVLVPALLIEGRRRAAAWFGGVFVALSTAWIAIAGFEGPRQVITFRGANGWGVESIIGTVVWIWTDAPVGIEAGAPRVGQVHDLVRPLLAGALLVTLGLVWLRASRFRGDQLGAPALAALAALLVWSPLFSLQYAIWLTPFIAIAALEPSSRITAGLGAAAVLLTGVLFPVAIGSTSAFAEQALLLVRNLSVVAIVIWWLLAPRDETPTSSSR